MTGYFFFFCIKSFQIEWDTNCWHRQKHISPAALAITMNGTKWLHASTTFWAGSAGSSTTAKSPSKTLTARSASVKSPSSRWANCIANTISSGLHALGKQRECLKSVIIFAILLGNYTCHLLESGCKCEYPNQNQLNIFYYLYFTSQPTSAIFERIIFIILIQRCSVSLSDRPQSNSVQNSHRVTLWGVRIGDIKLWGLQRLPEIIKQYRSGFGEEKERAGFIKQCLLLPT